VSNNIVREQLESDRENNGDEIGKMKFSGIPTDV